MYEYLINEKTVIFKNEPDMLAGLKAAEEAGYSIELVRDDSMSKKADDTSTFGKPSKEDTFMFGGPTPEEQLKATQLKASQGNFTQDPAESADVVSETPAQQDTELSSEGDSLESLLSDIPEVKEVPVLDVPGLKDKEIPRFEIEKKFDIPIEGPLGVSPETLMVL